MWIVTTILSAIFAGITAILAKCGIKKTDSDIATAIRTVIALIFSVLMMFIVGSYREISGLSATPVILSPRQHISAQRELYQRQKQRQSSN